MLFNFALLSTSVFHPINFHPDFVAVGPCVKSKVLPAFTISEVFVHSVPPFSEKLYVIVYDFQLA